MIMSATTILMTFCKLEADLDDICRQMIEANWKLDN